MPKVLLVDDDVLLANMYVGKFKAEGYTVIVGFNGEDALEKVATEKPDVILLDIMMPNMDGLTVLRRLKANPATSQIPVILLTNLGSIEGEIDEGMKLGAAAYLIKLNYTPQQVVAKVKEVMGQ